MPYIKQDKRDIFDPTINVLLGKFYQEGFTGNLNYLLYRVAKEFCHKYADYAAFLGELDAARLEVYRKMAGPYEDIKEIENGRID